MALVSLMSTKKHLFRTAPRPPRDVSSAQLAAFFAPAKLASADA